jgi:hypothetical protein
VPSTPGQVKDNPTILRAVVFDLARQRPGTSFDVRLEAPELLASLNCWKWDGLIAPVEYLRRAQTV